MQQLLILWVTWQLLVLWLTPQSSGSIWLVICWCVLLVSVFFDVGLSTSFLLCSVVHGCWGCLCFAAPPSYLLCSILFRWSILTRWLSCLTPFSLCLLLFHPAGLALNMLLLQLLHLSCLLLALWCIYVWRISVCNAYSTHVFDPHHITSVVLLQCFNVVSLDCMHVPCFSDVWFTVQQYSAPHGC